MDSVLLLEAEVFAKVVYNHHLGEWPAYSGDVLHQEVTECGAVLSVQPVLDQASFIQQI